MTKADVKAEPWVQDRHIEEQAETDTMNWGKKTLKIRRLLFHNREGIRSPGYTKNQEFCFFRVCPPQASVSQWLEC